MLPYRPEWGLCRIQDGKLSERFHEPVKLPLIPDYQDLFSVLSLNLSIFCLMSGIPAFPDNPTDEFPIQLFRTSPSHILSCPSSVFPITPPYPIQTRKAVKAQKDNPIRLRKTSLIFHPGIIPVNDPYETKKRGYGLSSFRHRNAARLPRSLPAVRCENSSLGLQCVQISVICIFSCFTPASRKIISLASHRSSWYFPLSFL